MTLLFPFWSTQLTAVCSCSFLIFLFSSFPAESQGQTNSVFKDYLPGSSDLPEQNKPVEPTSLWKQTPHTHNLPPGLEYLNQVLNLSKCLIWFVFLVDFFDTWGDGALWVFSQGGQVEMERLFLFDVTMK